MANVFGSTARNSSRSKSKRKNVLNHWFESLYHQQYFRPDFKLESISKECENINIGEKLNLIKWVIDRLMDVDPERTKLIFKDRKVKSEEFDLSSKDLSPTDSNSEDRYSYAKNTSKKSKALLAKPIILEKKKERYDVVQQNKLRHEIKKFQYKG